MPILANNRIVVKRTSTAGRTPNTTNAGNLQYIAAGELALNMTDKTVFTSDGTNLIYVGSNTVDQNVSNTLTVKFISANGGVGTSGQVLTSGAAGNVYWSTVAGGGSGTVTSVATGNGLTGGPITSTGTVSVVANSGIVANATGVYVNTAYIATLAANNSTYFGGYTWAAPPVLGSTTANGASLTYANVSGQVNTATLYAATSANIASAVQANATGVYTTGTMNATSHTVGAAFTANSTVVNAVAYYSGTLLIANSTVSNATHLGGVAAANYARTDAADSFDALVTFNANAVLTKSLSANGGYGTAGQVLTSAATGNVYWSTVSAGGGGGSTYMKGGSATVGSLATEGQNIFRVNANTINYNTTFVAGENGQATGPIAVASGITLTVQTGARISIV